MKISYIEAQAFSARANGSGEGFFTEFTNIVGVASPGAWWDDSRFPPLAEGVPHHDGPSKEQRRLMDAVISSFNGSRGLNIAIYAGFFGGGWGGEFGFDNPDSVFIFGDPFDYVLYAIDCDRPFAYYEERWGSDFAQVSEVWPPGRQWCVKIYPDAPYTFIGSNDPQVTHAFMAVAELQAKAIVHE